MKLNKKRQSLQSSSKNLHYSITIKQIQIEIETAGSKVRQIMNVQHCANKIQQPLFFLDFEPQGNCAVLRSALG